MTENQGECEIIERKDESQKEEFKNIISEIVRRFIDKLKRVLTYGDNFMR